MERNVLSQIDNFTSSAAFTSSDQICKSDCSPLCGNNFYCGNFLQQVVTILTIILLSLTVWFSYILITWGYYLLKLSPYWPYCDHIYLSLFCGAFFLFFYVLWTIFSPTCHIKHWRNYVMRYGIIIQIVNHNLHVFVSILLIKCSSQTEITGGYITIYY